MLPQLARVFSNHWIGYKDEEVVLFFDNDEPGRKAAEEAASVLPPGKVSIALLDDKYKDASDALMADDTEAIRKAIWDATEYLSLIHI